MWQQEGWEASQAIFKPAWRGLTEVRLLGTGLIFFFFNQSAVNSPSYNGEVYIEFKWVMSLFYPKSSGSPYCTGNMNCTQICPPTLSPTIPVTPETSVHPSSIFPTETPGTQGLCLNASRGYIFTGELAKVPGHLCISMFEGH